MAAVLDLFSRRVVGWSMSAAMTAELVTDALVMAIWWRGRPRELLHHSDGGSQYTSEAFQRLMAEHGVTCSLSRSGNVWDNAAMESFFSSLKIERVARKIYRTRDQARADVFDYIERFYNPRRRHSTIGYLSPMELEAKVRVAWVGVYRTGSSSLSTFSCAFPRRSKSSSAMRFDYKRYPSLTGSNIERPVIPITLHNPRAPLAPAVGYHGLVDSGADYCVFSSEISELLELDLTAGERYDASGPVAGESRPIYFHPIEIMVGPYGSPLRLSIWAGFMPDLADTGYGLLGRHGFFSGLTFVKFRDHLSEVEIGKRRR